jgi:hypothetical protein
MLLMRRADLLIVTAKGGGLVLWSLEDQHNPVLGGSLVVRSDL